MRILSIIIGIFLLSILVPISTCAAANSLQFEEGMKYSYSYEMPLYSLSSNFDIFVNVSNNDFWKGISVVTVDREGEENDSTRVYRFKISKNTYDFYETDYLREKTLYSDNVEFKKLTSEGSQSGISSFLVFLLHQNLYEFDMNSLISDGQLENTTFGGMNCDLTLEGPINYKNYNCYKITIIANYLKSYTFSGTLYISSAFPYLLVDWNTKVGGIDNYSYYTLEEVKESSFNFDSYNIDEAPNNSPKAIMNYSINDSTVDFDAFKSYDSDGSIVSYEWDFGDGTNASGLSVQHKYSEFKRYTVKLHVLDDEGKEGIDMEFIDIEENNIENNSKENQSELEESKETPGFGITIILIAFTFLIFFSRKKIE